MQGLSSNQGPTSKIGSDITARYGDVAFCARTVHGMGATIGGRSMPAVMHAANFGLLETSYSYALPVDLERFKFGVSGRPELLL